MLQWLSKGMVYVCLLAIALPLQATGGVGRQTAIIDTLGDLPRENDSDFASSLVLPGSFGWSLASVIALSGVLIIYLADTRDGNRPEVEEEYPRHKGIMAKMYAFIESMKCGKNTDESKISAGTATHDSTLIDSLYDDPERHAVVAMYVAKEPHKQS